MTRRLPKDGIFLHAYCPTLADASGGEMLLAAAGVGWPLLAHEEGRYPSWTLGDAGAPLALTLNPTMPWSELHVAMSDNHLNLYGAERLAAFFVWLCNHSRARLARTTAEVGFVTPDELDGNLEFVDWFQYWGEPIVRRWGPTHLLAGPFHQVTLQDDGAYSLLLSAEPDDAAMSRRAAAEFLGITLRPIHARNPATGDRIVLPWR